MKNFSLAIASVCAVFAVGLFAPSAEARSCDHDNHTSGNHAHSHAYRNYGNRTAYYPTTNRRAYRSHYNNYNRAVRVDYPATRSTTSYRHVQPHYNVNRHSYYRPTYQVHSNSYYNRSYQPYGYYNYYNSYGY